MAAQRRRCAQLRVRAEARVHLARERLVAAARQPALVVDQRQQPQHAALALNELDGELSVLRVGRSSDGPRRAVLLVRLALCGEVLLVKPLLHTLVRVIDQQLAEAAGRGRALRVALESEKIQHRHASVHAWRAHVAWRSPLEEPHLLQAAVCAPHSEERRRPEEQQ